MSQVNLLAVSLYTRPARIGVGGWVGDRLSHIHRVLDHMSVCLCIFAADTLGRDVHVSEGGAR